MKHPFYYYGLSNLAELFIYQSHDISKGAVAV